MHTHSKKKKHKRNHSGPSIDADTFVSTPATVNLNDLARFPSCQHRTGEADLKRME